MKKYYSIQSISNKENVYFIANGVVMADIIDGILQVFKKYDNKSFRYLRAFCDKYAPDVPNYVLKIIAGDEMWGAEVLGGFPVNIDPKTGKEIDE